MRRDVGKASGTWQWMSMSMGAYRCLGLLKVQLLISWNHVRAGSG